MFGIELNDLKEYLGYDITSSPTDVSRDNQLTLLLNAAFEELKSLTNRNLEYGSYRDTYQYLPQRIYLREWPIESVTSIVQGARQFTTDDYGLFLKSGFIHIKNGPCNVHYLDPADYAVITYVGGYETLPENIKLALFNAIQAGDLVNKQSADSGGVVKRISVYDVGVTDFAVSKDSGTFTMRKSLADQLEGLTGWAPTMGTPFFHESEYLGTVGSPE